MPDKLNEATLPSPETWKPPVGIIPESTSGREADYSPSEPTPADLGDPRVIAHQIDVREQAFNIIDNRLPEHIYVQLKNFIERVYLHREAIRTTKNATSFNRHITNPAHIHDDVVLEVIDKMKLGTAKPYETLGGMIALGNPAAEFKKLMHISAYRIEHLDPMREEVLDAIRIYDGEVLEEPTESYEIMTYDNADINANHVDFALAMTRKRLIGRVKDIDIFERSSFILRLDEDGYIDPQVASQLRKVQINSHTKKEIDGVAIWKTLMLNDVRFQEEVKRLLKKNDYETVIPLSTTIYGYNPVLDAEITKNERARGRSESSISEEILKGRKLAQGALKANNLTAALYQASAEQYRDIEDTIDTES